MRFQRIFFVGLFLFAQACNAALTPTERVKDAVDDIVVILKIDGLDREARWEKIGVIINKSFDFHAMSQSVLATNWKKATPEEKRRFVEFFSQYLEDTYRTKIEAYDDQEIRYLNESVMGTRAVVDTVIVAGRIEIPVSYKLRETQGRWLAYDVVIEGLSLVNNYRNTFSAIVRTEGMDGLLYDLQGRIDRYKSRRAKQQTTMQ